MLNKNRPDVQKVCTEFFISFYDMEASLIPLGYNDRQTIGEWLNSEEHKRFSDSELNLLSCISSKYKYIAKQKNGNLYFFSTIPFKGTYSWYNVNGTQCDSNDIFYGFFNSIKWEDNVPVYIDDYVDRK